MRRAGEYSVSSPLRLQGAFLAFARFRLPCTPAIQQYRRSCMPVVVHLVSNSILQTLAPCRVDGEVSVEHTDHRTMDAKSRPSATMKQGAQNLQVLPPECRH